MGRGLFTQDCYKKGELLFVEKAIAFSTIS
jgi:hypothetical protein